MKRTLKHPELWLNKRNELPVDGDPNMDWLEMRSVLDQHMPVPGQVKKPYNPKAIKWLYKFLIAISSAVVIYGVVQLCLTKKQQAPVIHVPKKENRVIPAPVAHAPALLKPMGKPGSSGLLPKPVIVKGGTINYLLPGKIVGKTGVNSVLTAGNGKSLPDSAKALNSIAAAKATKFANDSTDLHQANTPVPVIKKSKPIPDSVAHTGKAAADSLSKTTRQKNKPGNSKAGKKKKRFLQVFF